jgi:hypothetical protein
VVVVVECPWKRTACAVLCCACAVLCYIMLCYVGPFKHSRYVELHGQHLKHSDTETSKRFSIRGGSASGCERCDGVRNGIRSGCKKAHYEKQDCKPQHRKHNKCRHNCAV